MARTKGAKGKRTLGIPDDLKERLGHRDPAEVLGEVYSMDHKALAKLVRSAAGARAMALKVQAATAAMPYVHSKMPVAVTLNDEKLPGLFINRRGHQMQANQQLIKDRAEAVAQFPVAHGVEDVETKGKSDE